MATQAMPSAVVSYRNQYICDSMKIGFNSQRHDICFLYSKEGVRFRIRKVHSFLYNDINCTRIHLNYNMFSFYSHFKYLLDHFNANSTI